jgi:hypothetical protein
VYYTNKKIKTLKKVFAGMKSFFCNNEAFGSSSIDVPNDFDTLLINIKNVRLCFAYNLSMEEF